jgi:16S rRNA (guanine966-N2)-methyltransferase
VKVLKGSFKGVDLTSPDDMAVRPTVDHFKKHIIKIAEERKPKVIWDLFAGSGGVGIELLSLGAGEAVFVEQLNKALACLKLNLSQCQLKDPKIFDPLKVEVVATQVETFLKKPRQFGVNVTPDLVFVDPPYGQGLMKKVAPLLLSCELCSPETLFVAEHVVDDPVENIDGARGKIVSQNIYGPKVLTCFKKN